MTHPGLFFGSPAQEPAGASTGGGASPTATSAALPAIPPIGAGTVTNALHGVTQSLGGVGPLLTGPNSLLSGVSGALGGLQTTTGVPGLIDNVLNAAAPVATTAGTVPIVGGTAQKVPNLLGQVGTTAQTVLGAGH